MHADQSPPLTVIDRRYSRRRAYQNGLVWALGNGLTSSSLVIYLALELGASGVGIGISLILAAPRIAGLLRLAAPALIRWCGDRKRFCLGAYLSSNLVLLLLPTCVLVKTSATPEWGLAVLVAAWCVYHLLEYLATVALWSWFGDLVPLPVRGRFFGRRERWMVTGQAGGMLVAALFTFYARDLWPQLPKWAVYAMSAEAGVACMILSLIPLARMADPKRQPAQPSILHENPIRRLFAPLSDGRFRRLIYFGCWFSFFNGVTQSVQYLYPARVLLVSLFVMLALKTGMRLGQLGISPTAGRLADHYGNRAVMLVSLPIVATGPLFFFFATPEAWYWMIGAWVVWIAYAGLNVALPNLMLKLSPGEQKTGYIVSYYAISGLAVALGTILGGLLFDRYGDIQLTLTDGLKLDFYQASFLFGWITRTLGVVWLLLIVEPRRQP